MNSFRFRILMMKVLEISPKVLEQINIFLAMFERFFIELCLNDDVGYV